MDNEEGSLYAVIWAALGLVIVWAFVATLFYLLTLVDKGKSLADFGDAFGTLNALFSALALAGVIATVFMQASELKESRLDRKAQIETQRDISSQALVTAVATATAAWASLNARRYATLSQIQNEGRVEAGIHEFGRRKLLERLIDLQVAALAKGEGQPDFSSIAADPADITSHQATARELLNIASYLESCSDEIKKLADEPSIVQAVTRDIAKAFEMAEVHIGDADVSRMIQRAKNRHPWPDNVKTNLPSGLVKQTTITSFEAFSNELKLMAAIFVEIVLLDVEGD